jgi:hypothetical protein
MPPESTTRDMCFLVRPSQVGRLRSSRDPKPQIIERHAFASSARVFGLRRFGVLAARAGHLRRCVRPVAMMSSHTAQLIDFHVATSWFPPRTPPPRSRRDHAMPASAPAAVRPRRHSRSSSRNAPAIQVEDTALPLVNQEDPVPSTRTARSVMDV